MLPNLNDLGLVYYKDREFSCRKGHRIPDMTGKASVWDPTLEANDIKNFFREYSCILLSTGRNREWRLGGNQQV